MLYNNCIEITYVLLVYKDTASHISLVPSILLTVFPPATDFETCVDV